MTEPLVDLDLLIGLSEGQLEDDQITRHKLDAITTQIRNYCRWHVSPQITETITLDGPGSIDLALPTLRLAEIEQITDAGTDVDDPEWSKLGNVRKPDGRPWSTRYRGITATIRHGFDSTPDIVEVVLELVAQAVNSPAGTAAAAEKIGPFSFEAAATGPGARLAIGGATLLETQLAVLDRYRLEDEP